MKEIKLPFSTVKKMLIGDSKLRANPAAVKKYMKTILEAAKVNTIPIRAKTTEAKRKTIMAEDII